MKKIRMINLLLILITTIIIVILYYYYINTKSEASYILSNLDNKKYLVQNLENKEEAAYILSVINQRIKLLRDYLNENINKFPEYRDYINFFNLGIKKLVLTENAPDGQYTSYTLNKGEEIALCLRSKKTKDLHDLNLIMYVVIHELAHVACPEIGHTPLFKKIFIFFLNESIKIKIYVKDNYKIDPKEYCGLTITENLLDNS